MLSDVMVELMGDGSLFVMANAGTVVRRNIKFKVININIMDSGTEISKAHTVTGSVNK